jgi:AcrR family transcriptional regulator
MGTKERRERERAEVREKILEAARALFVSEGYEAVTMRKIAERIEYSPTAIYLHFADKTALIRELCDVDFANLAQSFGTIAELADPIERLRETGRAYVRFGIENPNHYRLMFMTHHQDLTFQDARLERGNPEEDAYAFLKTIIADAIQQGRFRPELTDVDLIAQTVWAGVHGVISLHIAKASDDWVEWLPLERRVEAMLDVLVDGLSSTSSKE